MSQPSLCSLQLIFTEHYGIGAKLVSEWLTIWQVAKLDSAFCCNSRNKFLQLISSSGVYLRTAERINSGREYLLKWLILRGGKVACLHIVGFAQASTFEKYVRKEGSHIRKIIFTDFAQPQLRSWLICAARHCQYLQEIDLSHCWDLAKISPVLAPCCGRLTTLSLSVTVSMSMGGEGLTEFVNHCPLMRFCNVQSGGLVPPTILHLIADKWKDLQSLLLPAGFGFDAWTEEHEAVVVKLIAQLPRLLQLCYAKCPLGASASRHELWESLTTFRETSTAASPLRYLWVGHLPCNVLRTILTGCPKLQEFGHCEQLDPDLLNALETSAVTKVHLKGTGEGVKQLSSLRGLQVLYMWEIQESMEGAIAGVCGRSPQITKLHLEFQKRPSLCLFPRMLCHTPKLRELHVEVQPDTEQMYADFLNGVDSDNESGAEGEGGGDEEEGSGSDDDSSEESNDADRVRKLRDELQRHVNDSTRAMTEVVKLLCPQVRYPHVYL